MNEKDRLLRDAGRLRGAAAGGLERVDVHGAVSRDVACPPGGECAADHLSLTMACISSMSSGLADPHWQPVSLLTPKAHPCAHLHEVKD